MENRELKALFKETASARGSGVPTPGDLAYKEFCQALTEPILQEVRLQSVVRGLFSEERLEPGAQASFPVADDFEVPVWVLPGLGRVAQNLIEGVGDEVFVPTFTVATAADWKVSYARDSRVDIALKSARAAARSLAEYEEESGWRVIVPAGTSAFAGAGLLRPRPAPIYEIAAADTGAGFFSKELLNKMMVGMKRAGRTLTDLYLSPEDLADVREWGVADVDDITRREIFVGAGLNGVWKVRFHEIEQLGGQGKFNINSSTSEFGPFQADGGGLFNDYTLTNPNTVDANGVIDTIGETQVWGFDLGVNDSLVMPIRKDFEAIEDPTLLREQKAGFYGWQEIGFAVLDPRMESMGVIDRSL